MRHPFHIVLLGLCLLHLVIFVGAEAGSVSAISGMLYGNGTPVGGDFINLWSAGRLVLEGRAEDIYVYERFMAYEVDLTGAPIGVRFWAYPPHSLLLVWPFGLFGFYLTLAIWSALGIGVLALGCRRFGLTVLETAIVLVSPAAVLCIYYGQTGNLATGLLLLAMAPRGRGELRGIGAAAVLTLKPQMGLLLPLYWILQRRWLAIAGTAASVIVLGGVALVVFGPDVWRDYLGDTLPGLSLLERHGTGPFMTMIPSMFMALRILTDDGDLALWLHGMLVVPALALCGWKLWRVPDPVRRAGIVMAATALITPYLHHYDLTLIGVAGLLVLRRFPPGRRGELAICVVVVVALALPRLVVIFNLLGAPLAPLVILGLLLLG